MKPVVVDPKTTSRAEAFSLWMPAPNPMVTFFKTLDVSALIKFSRRKKMKFNRYFKMAAVIVGGKLVAGGIGQNFGKFASGDVCHRAKIPSPLPLRIP